MTQPDAIYLAGPTAVGKSAVAMELADRLGGEIISVDSMQVYRGLDIGTAKPTREERDRIPHHLIDIVDLNQAFDAARFADLAKAAAKEIRVRGAIPVFCGGTGLYFKALVHGLGESPTADPALRKELEQTPLERLCEELQAVDQQTHARIDLNNPRRVVRAVEVARLTGKPYGEQRAAWTRGDGPTVFGLRREAADLRLRIDLRVDEMIRDGLIEETRRLMRLGLEGNQTAMQAIGYRQAVEHIRGERSLEETIELIKTRTRQFAKRQLTWLRNQMDVRWFDLSPESSPDSTVDTLIASLDS